MAEKQLSDLTLQDFISKTGLTLQNLEKQVANLVDLANENREYKVSTKSRLDSLEESVKSLASAVRTLDQSVNNHSDKLNDAEELLEDYREVKEKVIEHERKRSIIFWITGGTLTTLGFMEIIGKIADRIMGFFK